MSAAPIRTAARSALFVPASTPERIGKALASGADEVIVDLEDAVPPARKIDAREALAQWLAGPGQARITVRVNAAGTEWHADELALLATHPRIAALMLPKAEDPERIAALASKPIVALIETARGIANARAIAAAPGVVRLAFGSIDFQADLGIEGEDDALLAFRSEIVLASRLAERPAPLDGVCIAIDDAARIEAESAYARQLGFGGKLCIHPAQVALVNRVFSPTPAQLDWARRVVAADAASGGAAVAVDGKMIDRPVVAKANAILNRK